MNEALRKQLEEFITKNGIMRSHVAKVMNVNKSFITHFIQGKTGMSDENFQKLKDYLERGLDTDDER